MDKARGDDETIRQLRRAGPPTHLVCAAAVGLAAEAHLEELERRFGLSHGSAERLLRTWREVVRPRLAD